MPRTSRAFSILAPLNLPPWPGLTRVYLNPLVPPGIQFLVVTKGMSASGHTFGALIPRGLRGTACLFQGFAVSAKATNGVFESSNGQRWNVR